MRVCRCDERSHEHPAERAAPHRHPRRGADSRTLDDRTCQATVGQFRARPLEHRRPAGRQDTCSARSRSLPTPTRRWPCARLLKPPPAASSKDFTSCITSSTRSTRRPGSLRAEPAEETAPGWRPAECARRDALRMTRGTQTPKASAMSSVPRGTSSASRTEVSPGADSGMSAPVSVGATTSGSMRITE